LRPERRPRPSHGLADLPGAASGPPVELIDPATAGGAFIAVDESLAEGAAEAGDLVGQFGLAGDGEACA